MSYFSLRQQWFLLVIVLLLLGILYFQFYDQVTPPSPGELGREVLIEVLGEVRHPGVYPFQNPPTLGEVIEKAGGLAETVQFDLPQTSETLETGTLLTVMKESSQTGRTPLHPSPLPSGESQLPKQEHHGITHEEIKIRTSRMDASKLLVFSIPLDLNRVSFEELCLIPGIGESLAQEVIAYRKRRKGFRSVEELRNVRGIGEKKFKSFKPYFVIID